MKLPGSERKAHGMARIPSPVPASRLRRLDRARARVRTDNVPEDFTEMPRSNPVPGLRPQTPRRRKPCGGGAARPAAR